MMLLTLATCTDSSCFNAFESSCYMIQAANLPKNSTFQYDRYTFEIVKADSYESAFAICPQFLIVLLIFYSFLGK